MDKSSLRNLFLELTRAILHEKERRFKFHAVLSCLIITAECRVSEAA